MGSEKRVVKKPTYRTKHSRTGRAKMLGVILTLCLVLSSPGGLAIAEDIALGDSKQETEEVAPAISAQTQVEGETDETQQNSEAEVPSALEGDAAEDDANNATDAELSIGEGDVADETSNAGEGVMEEEAVADEAVGSENTWVDEVSGDAADGGETVTPMAAVFTPIDYPGSDLPAGISKDDTGSYSYATQGGGTQKLAHGTYGESGGTHEEQWFLVADSDPDTANPFTTSEMLVYYINTAADGFEESTPGSGVTPTFYGVSTTQNGAETYAGTRAVWAFVDFISPSTYYYRVFGSYGGVEGFYESDQYGNVRYVPVEANTTLDQINATGEGNKPIKKELTDDAAYIKSLRVIDIADGTVPFDSDNNPGNDNAVNNLNVRTYDSVSYTLEYITAIQDPDVAGFESGRVYVQFELDADVRQAEFATSSMAWLKDAKVQYRVGETLYSTIEQARTASEGAGEATITQVLTGYRQLNKPDSSPVALPGTGTLSATVNVKSMQNGDEFAPRFIVWTTGNDPDPNEMTEHGAKDYTEAKEATADKVQVSAAPRYNIRLTQNSNTGDKGDFDFSEVSDAVNSDKGVVHGRVYGYNVTVQLYNDSADKGLKGIELPQGEITFDVDMTFEASIMGTNSFVDITEKQFSNGDNDPLNYYDNAGNGYTPMPLLWDYRLAADHNQTKINPLGDMGRNMLWGSDYSAMAANYTVVGRGGGKAGAYEGGSWTATQIGKTISFTLDGYLFADTLERGVNLPTTHYGNPWTAIDYGENIGCFSAASFQIIQPMPKSQMDLTQDMDFRLEMLEYNMTAASVSKQQMEAQANTTDDKSTRIVYMKMPGKYHKKMLLQNKINGSYLGTNYATGDGWRSLGETFNPIVEYSIGASTDPEGYAYAANIFVKFDNRYLDVVRGQDKNSIAAYASTPPTLNFEVLYVGRIGGWEQGLEDAQILYTREDDHSLQFFSSIDALIEAGYTCVGFLLEGRGDGESIIDGTGQYALYAPQMQVKPNAAPGEVAAFVDDVRIWTKDDYDSVGGEIPSRIDGNVPTNSVMLDSDSDMSFIYSKAVYDETGLSGGHVGGVYAGNSVLIVGSKATIGKSIDQLGNDNTLHTAFEVSNNQRYADFVLSPKVELTNQGGTGATTTTVTITDTLPKGLTYLNNSTTFGGTYNQSTPRGKQGTVTGGLTGAEYEPTLGTDAKGQQTLTWVIDDVTIGEAMEKIHFTCVIGTPGNDATDVQRDEQLLNTVIISSTEDLRVKSTANGNLATQGLSIVKLDAAALVKSVNPSIYEIDETVNFALAYSNTGSQPLNDVRLMDVLPYKGDGRGTNFNGSYAFKSALSLAATGTVDFDLYYTTNTAARTKTAKDYSVTQIASGTDGWTKAGETSGSYAVAEDAVAIVLVGSMDAGASISLDVPLKPNDNRPTDVYGNNATMVTAGMDENVEAVTVQAAVVNRIISGVAWYDANGNGVRDNGEPLLSDVTVRLVKSGTDTPATDVLGQGVPAFTTGSDGSYRFENLPEGNFDIVFAGSSSFPIANYTETQKNVGKANRDSDIDGVYTGDKLSTGKISNISMPSIGEFIYFTYESANNDAGFTQSAAQSLSGTKTYTDSATNAPKAMTAGQFTFEVKDSIGTLVATGANDASGNITFTPDLSLYGEGEHNFTVTEVQGSQDGVEYDTKAVLLTVVTEYSDHELKVTEVRYRDRTSDGTLSDASGITFDNMHVPGRANIVAQKAVSGTDAPAISSLDGKFSFTIVGTDANGQANMPSSATVTNVGSTVSFGGINYDATGTYSYRITEAALPDADPSWRIDTTTVDVVVTVTLGTSGELETSVTYSGGTGTSNNTFTNTYIKPTSAALEISKAVTNADNTDQSQVPDISDLDGKFSFAIESASTNAASLLPKTTTITNTGAAAAFDSVTYTQTGVYEYTISERAMAPADPRWTIDTRTITATVTVSEVNDSEGNPVLEADVVYSGADGIEGNTFTNIYEYATVEVAGSKTWNDENNSAGLRPSAIAVELRADGEIYDTKTVTEAENWVYSWSDLPKYTADNSIATEIVWTITEKSVPHYATEIDGYNIANSYTPGKTSRTVVKVWEDFADIDSTRPESIEVQLYANDAPYGQPEVLNAGNNWTYTWTELPLVSDAEEVAYTVKELAVPEKYEANYSADGFTITNTYTPDPQISVVKSVDKTDAQPGDELTYTLEVSNTGEGTATAVRVRDYIPERTTFVSVSENGNYVDGDKPYVEWMVMLVKPGETVSLSFVVTIDEEPSTVNPVANTASYDPGDGSETSTNTVETTVTATVGDDPATGKGTPVTEQGKSLFTPKTGDDVNLLMLLSVGLVSALIALSVALRYRGKRRSEK